METLRPNRRVFLLRPVLRTALLTVIFALGAHFFLPLFLQFDPGLFAWLGIALGLTAWVGLRRFIAYQKTFYHFYDDRLVVKTGTLTTTGTVDLPYRNVTQVILKLPFLEYRLFSTGYLTVHTAGSMQGTAHLLSVSAPKKLYQRLADKLRDNGFSLQRKSVVQRERPHFVGTILDTSGVAVGGLLAIITLGLTVGGAVIDILELQNFYQLWDVFVGEIEPGEGEEAQWATRGILGLAIVAVVGGILGFAKLFLHFIDLNRRTYILWEDVVDYEDGFLTETRSFIPIENLADTSTQEPFLKRLFGMSNVELSPHGSSQGIRFPSMPRAAKFRDNLSRLIEAMEPPGEAEAEVSGEGEEGFEEELEKAPLLGAQSRLPDVQGPKLTFKPSIPRRIVGAFGRSLGLPLLLLIVGVAGYFAFEASDIQPADFDIPLEEVRIQWVFLVSATALGALFLLNVGRALFFCFTTSFGVGRRKMSWVRDFISRDEVEFTNDKITTLEVHRDLIDRVMGTASFSFYSIGNAIPIVFEDLSNSKEREEEIRHRLGLSADEPEQVYRPRVSLLNFLSGRLGYLIFNGLLITGALVGSMWWQPAVYIALFFVVLIPIRFLRDYVFFTRCRLRLFEDYISFQRGILRRHHQFVAFEQARSVETMRYPGRECGRLRLIPGSDRSVFLRYLPDIDALHEELDDRLHAFPMRPVRQKEELDRTEISRRRPMARNKAVVTGLLLTITVVGIPLALISVVWIILYARRMSFIVEEGRVKRVSGIFYRTTKTVLANRIDQLVIHRGLLNTVFNNGQVSVLTVGSSLPEMRLGPVRDEDVLYEELERLPPGR